MSNNRSLLQKENKVCDEQSKPAHPPISLEPEQLFLIRKRNPRKLTTMNYAPIAAREIQEKLGLPTDLLSNNASMKAACLAIKNDEEMKLKSEAWLAEQLKIKHENVPDGISRDSYAKHNLKQGKECFENLMKIGESVLICGTLNGRTYMHSFGNVSVECVRHLKRLNVDMNSLMKFFLESEETKKRSKKSALIRPNKQTKTPLFKKL